MLDVVRQIAGGALLALGMMLVWHAAGLAYDRWKQPRTTMRRMPRDIVIASRPQPPVVVELIGEKYECKAPKKSLILAVMMKLRVGGADPQGMQDMFGVLLRKMFGKEIAPSVQARLDDEDDELDFDHIMELANALIGAATPDPTTSSSDSLPTP
jgi:hypothetical protein